MKTFSMIALLSAGLLTAACASDNAAIGPVALANASVVEAQAAGAVTASPARMTAAQDKLRRARLRMEDGDDDQARLLAGEARADANAALADATKARARGAETQLAMSEGQNARLNAKLTELEVKQTERGAVITLGDVLFATDEARLTGAGLAKVAGIASFLRDNPGQAVVIEGHADATGAASYNQPLSEAHAASAANTLPANGVETPRIIYTGRGENSPIASNATAMGRQMNRRVEVILVEKS
jgi:outer membrane protein OmpA-like peptidoglycan-associated protein